MSNNQNTGTDLVPSQKFTKMLEREFKALSDTPLTLSTYEKKLAQHLFIRCDTTLKKFEEDRQRDNRNVKPFTWENIKLKTLVMEAIPIVQLGLDALLPGHVYPVPMLEAGGYHLCLWVGYKGLLWTRLRYAVDSPVEIRIELLYSKDKFVPIMKDKDSPIETYEFKITDFADRGELIGGFGYVVFEDPKKNKLLMIPKKDIEKIRSKAKTDKFWKDWLEEMYYKTVTRKVCKNIDIDPEKVNTRAVYDLDRREFDDVRQAESRIIEQAPEQVDFKEPAQSNFNPVTGEVIEDLEDEQEEKPKRSRRSRKKQGPEEEPDQDPETGEQTELPMEPGF